MNYALMQSHRLVAISPTKCKAEFAGQIGGAVTNFTWPPRMPLLGRAREPPCNPYYFTMGLFVTANVYPQLSGTRSTIPDKRGLMRIVRRTPAVRVPASGFHESNHGKQDGKNRTLH